MSFWRKSPVSYKGIEEKSAPGTHIACSKLLEKHLKNSSPQAYLELATGNGAFAARMRDMGVSNIEAIDLEPNDCKLLDLNVKKIDLNLNFTKNLSHTSYNLISAIEIIEHLDNPRDFVGQISSIMSKESYLLVSTPNVEHWLSRLNFLIKGRFRYFGPSDYKVQRHINPLTDFQIKCIFEEKGLEIIESISCGESWGDWKKMIFAPIFWPQILIKGRKEKGEVNAYLVKKKPLN